MARYPTATDVRLEPQRSLTRRRTRAPQHQFAVVNRPWQIVPCIFAPVLPGETLKSAMIQMRSVSDPIVSNVQGWWLEFYLFYVRVGDLKAPDDTTLRSIISDPSTPGIAGEAAVQDWYHAAGTPNLLLRAYQPCIRAYFRKEGQEWNAAQIGSNYAACRYTGVNGLDSLYTDAELGVPTGADTWNIQWAAFQVAREAKLTTNTWEEYLAKAGVATPPKMVEPVQDFQIPELVRFVRDFALPVPTVDPTSGAIRSTIQWSLAERIDKRRFFAEPGWLLGMIVVRPKVYLANQPGNLADWYCNSNTGWLPPEFDTDPHTSMVSFNNATGPLPSSTVKYWVDTKDLYLYGDQFTNIATGAVNPGPGSGMTFVTLPQTTLANKVYPSLTDAQALFVDGGGTGNAQWVHTDGICSLRIASRIGEATN